MTTCLGGRTVKVDTEKSSVSEIVTLFFATTFLCIFPKDLTSVVLRMIRVFYPPGPGVVLRF